MEQPDHDLVAEALASVLNRPKWSAMPASNRPKLVEELVESLEAALAKIPEPPTTKQE